MTHRWSETQLYTSFHVLLVRICKRLLYISVYFTFARRIIWIKWISIIWFCVFHDWHGTFTKHSRSSRFPIEYWVYWSWQWRAMIDSFYQILVNYGFSLFSKYRNVKEASTAVTRMSSSSPFWVRCSLNLGPVICKPIQLPIRLMNDKNQADVCTYDMAFEINQVLSNCHNHLEPKPSHPCVRYHEYSTYRFVSCWSEVIPSYSITHMYSLNFSR